MTKLKSILVALTAVVLFSNSSNAQAIRASYSLNYEAPLVVKYLGSDGNYLTFQVTVKPELAVKATFAIADKNEGELYSTAVTPAANVKTIKIEKKEDQVLNFKLVSGGKTYAKSFTVNTSKIETTTVAERDVTLL